MSNDCQTLQSTVPAPRWLKAAAWALTAAAAAALLLNAATTSIWEDEANGYFLSSRPLGEMLALMADNIHEDPPLFDAVMNGWIRVVGRNLFWLRGLSIAFWFVMLPGLFLSVRRLASERAAWAALAVAALLPLNWLMPASLRWYSLFACLCIWNFYFFLRMVFPAGDDRKEGRPESSRLLRSMPYWLTGAAMWYTNYSALVVFFSHLLIAVFCPGPKRPRLADLVFSWTAIGLLYVPWLPTFYQQLGASPKSHSLANMATSIWVLLAGEFSTPLELGMAIPVAALAAAVALGAAVQWRQCWIPVLVIAVVLLAMCLAGVIWTRRVLFLSPFVAMLIALAICPRESAGRRLFGGRVCMAGLLVAVSALSLAQMARRTDWLSYRWLDPCREAVERVQSECPQAVILTNSNPVFFYLDDGRGKNLAQEGMKSHESGRPRALIYPFPDHLLPDYEPLLADASAAAYIYQAAYGGPVTAGYGRLVERMARFGFEPVRAEGLLKASSGFLRHHPLFRGRELAPIDEHRVVVVHFRKAAGLAKTSPRRGNGLEPGAQDLYHSPAPETARHGG